VDVSWASENEVMDILGYAGTGGLRAVRRVILSNSVEVFVDRSVACAKLGQYTGLSTIK